MDYLFTLVFIKRGNEILMINREKDPWMGFWNGLGGKRLLNESSLDCITREIEEEANIIVSKEDIIDKGIVTWNSDFKAVSSGLHLYLVELPDDYVYETPISTIEGILSWKKIDWISNKNNLGVSYNIPYFINNVIYDDKRYLYHCTFDGMKLVSVEESIL